MVDRQPYPVERLAVTGPGGNQGQQHLVVGACERAFTFATFVDDRHRDAHQATLQREDFGAQHIMQVDEPVETDVAPQLAEQPPQPSQPLIFLKVDPHHPEIGRGIEKHRGHRLAGQNRELHFGVTQTRAVYHRDGHGHIAQG